MSNTVKNIPYYFDYPIKKSRYWQGSNGAVVDNSYRVPKGEYYVLAQYYPDYTLRSRSELGKINGVNVHIRNDYDQDGIQTSSDTIFNGVRSDDPRYQYYKRMIEEKTASHRNGGTMNRINYFENGGQTQNQQEKAQQEAFMRALLEGDPSAAQQLVQVAAQNPKSSAAKLVQDILDAEQKGNTEVSKAAQAIKQAIKQMQGQATSAKWGSKLGYIRSLKYAQGGKACPACEKGAPIKVEEKACGGKAKKAKKRYFGGWL